MIKIRQYEKRDAEAVRAIFVDAIRGLATVHYSQAQVDVWSGVMGDHHSVHARRTDGRTTWLAVDNADQPLAYIDLEADGHIDHLFCRPEAAGQGLASALYATLEQFARAQGINYLYVEASESAKPVFGVARKMLGRTLLDCRRQSSHVFAGALRNHFVIRQGNRCHR